MIHPSRLGAAELNNRLTATLNYTVHIKDVALQELFIQQPRVV